jgi:hypothetical protein
LFRDVLVNGVVGETRKGIRDDADLDFGLIRFAEFEDALGERFQEEARIERGTAARCF